MSSTTLCVNDTFWDTLAVEMGDEIDQVEVLEKERSILAHTLGFVWVRIWDTV